MDDHRSRNTRETHPLSTITLRTLRSYVLPLLAPLLLLGLVACAGDDAADGPEGRLAFEERGAAAEARAEGGGQEPGGPPPVSAGRTDRRLADTEEIPVDSCDLASVRGSGRRLDPERSAVDDSPWTDPITFAVQFADEVNPHRLMSAFVMPGETVDIEPTLTDPNSRFTVAAAKGRVERAGGGAWRWIAPGEPGIYRVNVTDTGADETMCLQVFVLTPYNGEETLNGYRIGQYPTKPFRGLEAYRRPAGLVEVTEENRHTWVSPHFQLKQFVCKQESGYPKYLALSSRLLLKLEMLLQEVQEEGIEAETFYVMSAYRTPFYNRAIGNQTNFSRHTFGDAADIFVDRNENGVMDDLNGDGRVTVADAKILEGTVESLYNEPWYRPFVGGLGLYGPNPVRGPFIHVDTRGYRARW